MPAVVYAVVSLYALAVFAQQTITYSAGAAEWNLTGPVQRVKRNTLRNMCPDISETDDADALYIPASYGTYVSLPLQGAHPSVFRRTAADSVILWHYGRSCSAGLWPHVSELR